MEVLSGSVTDPAILPSSSSHNARLRANEELIDIMTKVSKTRASHPSKPCRATSALAGRAYSAAGQAASALHSVTVLQVFQAKMLANEEAGLDSASLRDLRSATDLALYATKATTQAIERSISSLIVLERHLWLTMMEIERGGLSFLPPRSGFIRQPVWTSCGGLC